MTTDEIVQQTVKNLRYYIQSAEPPKEACKPFHNGSFSGTDINAMWRIKQLTALFGPCGIGWYTEVTKREIIAFDVTTQKAFVDINLYIRDPATGEWSKPIQGTGGNKWVSKSKEGKILVNDECFKMAETDALGSACKKLGFGASIYWSQDESKYTLTDEDMESVPEPSNRAKIAKDANSDPFFSKENTKVEEIERNLDTAEQCRQAIDEYIEQNWQELSPILIDYSKEYGLVSEWDAGIVVRVYKELRDAGIEIRKVSL